MRTVRRACAGVILIEVLVSLLLVMVSLLGMSTAMIYAFKATRYGSHAQRATELAQTYLEKAHRVPFAALVNGPDFPATFTVIGLPSGQGTVTFVDNPSFSSATMETVVVTIAWNGGTSDIGSVTLSTTRTTN